MVEQVIGLHTLWHWKSSSLDIPDKLSQSRDRAHHIRTKQQWFDRALPYHLRQSKITIKHLLPCIAGVASKEFVTSVACKQFFDSMLTRKARAIVGRQRR